MLTHATLKLENEYVRSNYTTPWSFGSQSKANATVSVVNFNNQVFLSLMHMLPLIHLI